MKQFFLWEIDSREQYELKQHKNQKTNGKKGNFRGNDGKTITGNMKN
jgi:hypothetical protein